MAVVAKHPWYLQDALESFNGTPHVIWAFGSVPELQESVNSAESEFHYIFFPHVSTIIPSDLHNNFRCIGFHTGDLPKDRGGSPIQNKILMKEYLTRVSAFQIGEEIDGGAIYTQRQIDLSFGDVEDILKRVSLLCAQMMLEIVNNDVIPKSQLGAPSTFKRLSPQDSLIPDSLTSLNEVYDRIRMVDGLDYPKAHIFVGNLRITFENAKLEGETLTSTCSFTLGGSKDAK